MFQNLVCVVHLVFLTEMSKKVLFDSLVLFEDGQIQIVKRSLLTNLNSWSITCLSEITGQIVLYREILLATTNLITILLSMNLLVPESICNTWECIRLQTHFQRLGLEHNVSAFQNLFLVQALGNGKVLCHISYNLGCNQDILLQADAILLSSLSNQNSVTT